MWKDSHYVEHISPPKVEYSMFVDYMQKISEEKAIAELSIRGLSRYRRVYDKKILDPFDRRDDSFADNTRDTTREEAAQRLSVIFR